MLLTFEKIFGMFRFPSNWLLLKMHSNDVKFTLVSVGVFPELIMKLIFWVIKFFSKRPFASLQNINITKEV